MERRRVVITGLGAVTPIGLTAGESWQAVKNGVCGIGPITHYDPAAQKVKLAAEVKGFDPEALLGRQESKRMGRFTQFAVVAAQQLLKDSGLVINDDNAYDVGVILGIGLGGLKTIETYHAKLLQGGPGKVSPFLIPMLISNMGPGQIAIFTGAKGPNIVTTTACASAIHGIGTAFSEILLGRISTAITGGVEATVTPLGVAGFTALKALSSHYNDDPTKASRPFDGARDGFVIGEGAGLLQLEELEHAKARGAKIYAEVVGYGASDDAFHMTAPADSGEGMARAMQNALRDAGLAPEAIGHINAHATSTQLNDKTETKGIKLVFGEHASKIKISATKSMTGHLLGGAGGVEAVFTALALRDQFAPPTIHYEQPDPECDLDYVPNVGRAQNMTYALSNSLGFGGHNACIALRRWEG